MTDSSPGGHAGNVSTSFVHPAVTVPVTMGEQAAAALSFEAIYDEHFAFVWRTVRRLGVPERHIDDAVQDVFIIVHRRLGDFQGRSSMRSWLFGIARRVAKDHRRRVSRKERAGELVPGDMADASAQTPLEALAAAQAAAVLHTLLESLDDNKREVFILAELEQMTAPEIADAIGAKLNTVYSRLRAAREEVNSAAARYRARANGGPL